MMRFLAVLLAVLAVSAFAQDQGVQRQLIQRQQQSDAFLLQLRQSQERLNVPPNDFKRLQEINARQFSERQRLGNVSDRQLSEIRADMPQELRPYERQKADDERRPLTIPAGEISQKTLEKPRPLIPTPGGIVRIIEAPR